MKIHDGSLGVMQANDGSKIEDLNHVVDQKTWQLAVAGSIGNQMGTQICRESRGCLKWSEYNFWSALARFMIINGRNTFTR